MKRIVTLLAAMAVMGATVIASALELQVEAGVLQTQSMTLDIEIPEGQTVTVIARRFNLNNNNRVGTDNTAQFTLPGGRSYTIGWDGGEVVACSSVGFTVPDDEIEGIDGVFVVDGDVTRSLCSDPANGAISVTVVSQ
jgi:hypothetical protein